MKLIIAPNAFKESLDAPAVALALARGWRRVFPEAEIVEIPVADGGDGTAQAFARATGARLVMRTVTGPLGQPVEAHFAWDAGKKLAVIEMAQAAGLWRVPPKKRNPMKTTTRGVGELVLAAVKLGAKKIIIGLGGSATVDGGTGFAAALGWRLLDQRDKLISDGGKGLLELARIEPPANLDWMNCIEWVGATDVKNPLTGAKGAAQVFGPQKGASTQEVEKLDIAMRNYAAIIQRDMHKSVDRIAGTGAAGGLGAALVAFTGAKLKSGIETFLGQTDFYFHLQTTDLVLTGEGCMDGQTLHGKAPMGVAKAAAAKNIPVIGFAGMLGEGHGRLLANGFTALFSIAPGPISLEEAMRNTAKLLAARSESVARVYRAGGVDYL